MVGSGEGDGGGMEGMVGQGGGVVNGMVGQGGGVVDGMVGHGGVDEGGGVVDSVVGSVGHRGVGGRGVDDGVLDEGLVGAGHALVLHVRVVLGEVRMRGVRRWFLGHILPVCQQDVQSDLEIYNTDDYDQKLSSNLLVLVHEVVHDLRAAVGQVDHVLPCRRG